MAGSPTRYRFTVKDYHRMAEARVFAPNDRVELIDGEVYDVAPIGSRHAASVKRLARVFHAGVRGRAIVSVQDPVELNERNELQPDVALLRPTPDDYAAHHPGPSDVLLVVEVADATVDFDRSTKVPLYLASGILEVWVVDLPSPRIEVFGAGDGVVHGWGHPLAPQAFPDLLVEVTEIVG
ncbi:MAG: Uma2 family endonuclease [Actinomycetota bacterium]|nr:Uma2 family endonuclease [Actinomycetota bacterium]